MPGPHLPVEICAFFPNLSLRLKTSTIAYSCLQANTDQTWLLLRHWSVSCESSIYRRTNWRVMGIGNLHRATSRSQIDLGTLNLTWTLRGRDPSPVWHQGTSTMGPCMKAPIRHYSMCRRLLPNTCPAATAKLTTTIDRLPLRMWQRMFNSSSRWRWIPRTSMKCTCRRLSSRHLKHREQAPLPLGKRRNGVFRQYLAAGTSRRQVLLNQQIISSRLHPSRELNRVNRPRSDHHLSPKSPYLLSATTRRRRKRKLHNGQKSWKWQNEKLRLELKRNERGRSCRKGIN